MITQEKLKELLSYDALSGDFVWIKYPAKRKDLYGKIAGSKNVRDGYIRIFIDGKSYLAHRLAWLYETGIINKIDIDHIDGNRSNNMISNLREATRSINLQNLKKAKIDNLSSGLLGVCFDAKAGKYRSAITLNGKRKHLGYYETAEKAHGVYLEEKRRIHAGCTI